MKKLDDEDRRIVGEDIATVEFGWPVGMPLCRSVGHELWEVLVAGKPPPGACDFRRD